VRPHHGYAAYTSFGGPTGHWSRLDLMDRAYCWFRVVPAALKPELLDMSRSLARAGHAHETFTPLAAGALSARLTAFGDQLMRELFLGSGIVYLVGLDSREDPLDDQQLRWAYLLVGLQLGLPMAAPTRLLDISKRNACARPGRTPDASGHPETSFHTDGAPAQPTPDLVGTLCLWPARSGGEYQVASALRAREVMRRRYRPLLDELHEPFIRVGTAGGAAPARGDMVQPVFNFESGGSGISLAYHRQQIEAGHRLADIPLRPTQRQALDRLDDTLNDPCGRMQFRMRRGDMLFVNNHLVAHNRRDYTDDPAPARCRLVVRLWLAVPPAWVSGRA
jgi:hypothetical protein